MMFWCLRGDSCLNRRFSRIIRIARILAKVKKNCLNQDFQDSRIFRIEERALPPPQPQRGDMSVENCSRHSLEPQRGDICYRLNRRFSQIKRIEESIISGLTNLSHLRFARRY